MKKNCESAGTPCEELVSEASAEEFPWLIG
jgi:hypothetical protein